MQAGPPTVFVFLLLSPTTTTEGSFWVIFSFTSFLPPFGTWKSGGILVLSWICSCPCNKSPSCRTQGSVSLFYQNLHSDWASTELTADGFPTWKYLFAMENDICHQITLYKPLSFLPGLLLKGWNDTPFSGWYFCPYFLSAMLTALCGLQAFVHVSSK